ncbi:MAG: branched-chain amino acid ABC transporter [Candidatus Thioglobus sp.]|jgi:branched-subunit amino acid transport protein AzlD|uniref:branched-chain amino acid transporter permease n=1 Tax=Candidatus Thioglobus sp. TaxID=2026721 RepID=UPI001D83D821|nr:AzlD domain-containing protein [Candidatus Thioglobus sp.]MBT3186117.1 branched-chain amino acid ABC transporter [Candidatus Thioglobus sp.]MBT3431567.1 branched-chain amino acid ABC transporter [Candidatus Thioglobus sp.]MBT3965659.1 branched-chain amino acid ABC transporter [Candidatus Thioglobus sp.]MBT4922963.1 branched-chain amino acid ABC transporter [Candidatus Thioglobus sp.]MBT5286623.1 branched-chain amino acid ABC transporter [Candidatus Thioglobus sp.]
MSNTEYILTVILVMTIATFSTRIMPFLFFHGRGNHPIMSYIAKYTPPMIMSILVVYTLKDVNFSNEIGLYTVLAVVATITIHVWKGNPLVSIFTGTFLYMFLIQM